MPRLMPQNVAAWEVWRLAAPHLDRDEAWLEVEGGKRKLFPVSQWRLDMAAVRMAMEAAGVNAAETLEKLNVILETYREVAR